MQRSNDSTPSSSRVIALLTLSPRERPATLWRELLSATFMCDLVLLVINHRLMVNPEVHLAAKLSLHHNDLVHWLHNYRGWKDPPDNLMLPCFPHSTRPQDTWTPPPEAAFLHQSWTWQTTLFHLRTMALGLEMLIFIPVTSLEVLVWWGLVNKANRPTSSAKSRDANLWFPNWTGRLRSVIPLYLQHTPPVCHSSGAVPDYCSTLQRCVSQDSQQHSGTWDNTF